MAGQVRNKVTIIIPTEIEKNRQVRKFCTEQVRKFTSIPYDLKIIQFEKSFAHTVNLGIQESRKDTDIIILNDDVFVRPFWIEKFREMITSEKVGLVGVKLRYPNTRIIQHAGVHFMKDKTPIHIGQLTIDSGIYDQIENVPAVTFACVYIPRKTIQKVGLLDESYKIAYFEDTDYCMRVLKAGLKIKINNKFYNYHAESVTTRKIPNHREIFLKNMEKFKTKWGDYIETITI